MAPFQIREAKGLLPLPNVLKNRLGSLRIGALIQLIASSNFINDYIDAHYHLNRVLMTNVFRHII
jgi:hypothetical protein